MSPEREREFAALEAQRRQAEEMALSVSEPQLRWPPAARRWSLLQIVEHLVITDEQIGRGYPAAETPLELPPMRLPPRAWRRAMVVGAIRRGLAVPLPAPGYEPRGSDGLPALLRRWAASRAAMRAALSTEPAGAVRFSHPILGPLTGEQMLTLGIVHQAHHLRQAAALRSEAGFPPA